MSEDKHCGGGHGHGLSCREISEFLASYLERELAGQVHEAFEHHLRACPPCGHYLDGYAETIKLVRRCGRVELERSEAKPEPPPEDLIQAILAAKAQEPG